METFHLLISGKVQGVFFRETSRRFAEKLNVKGWIKNTSDGNVEALVTGDEKALNDFVNFCKEGPERAAVDEVKVSKQQRIDFDKFEVIRRK
jgi:acylphosphatase